MKRFRIIAILMVFVIGVTAIPNESLAGETKSIFNNERLKIDFVINSQWEKG